MTAPSIRVNGGTAGVKASVSATTAVTAALDSTDGIRSCAWSVIGTDETSAVGSYTLVQSGSVGQSVAFTSLGAGTAMILRVIVNGGIDLQTGLADASGTSATVKVYVPTASGYEVGAAGEQYESNATTGATGIVNAGVRAIDAVSPGGVPVKIVRVATTAALPANTRSGNVLTANANGAFAAIDGVTLSAGEAFLAQNEGGGASHVNNGAYTLTTVGDGSTPWTATRAIYWDASSELVKGTVFRIQDGTTYGGKERIYRTSSATINVTAQGFGADGYAPATAQYLCATADANLSSEVAIDAITSTVTFASTSTTPVALSRTDSATAATVNVATCIASSSGTTAAGFGPSVTFQGKQGSGSTETMGRLDVVWTDVTGSSEDTKIALRTRTAGAAVTAGACAEFSGTAVTLAALAGAATRITTATSAGALGTVSGTAGLVTVASSGAPTVSNPAILVNGSVPANVSNGLNTQALSATVPFLCAGSPAVVLAHSAAATGTVLTCARLLRVADSSVGTAGIGAALSLEAQDAAGNEVAAGSLAASLTTVTEGAHVGQIVLSVASAGALVERATLSEAGAWTTDGVMQTDAGFDSETATTLPIGGRATQINIFSAVATGSTGAGVRVHNDAGIRTAGYLAEFGDDSTFAFKSGVDYRGVYDGPVLWATSLKTSNYTAAAWDQVLCDPTGGGGGFTVSVPDGTTALKGRRIGVKNYGTSTNTITIDTVTPGDIQGSSTTITTAWGYVELECIGADGWIIVSRVT